MKKFLLFLPALVAFLSTTAYAQVPKKVIVEEFTNASCGPCAAQNPQFNAFIEANRADIIAIKRQVWFPGYDPMYESNTAEVQADWAKYEAFYSHLGNNGVTGVPCTFINGEFLVQTWGGTPSSGSYNGSPLTLNAAKLNVAKALTSPVSMAIEGKLNDDLSQVEITVTITNETADAWVPGDGRLKFNIIEKEINYPSAPGSNGEKEFTDVFRKYLPSAAGIEIPELASGESYTNTFTYDLDLKYVFVKTEMAIVGYIQDSKTHYITQAAESDKLAIPEGLAIVDVTLKNLTQSVNEFCGENLKITPSFEFTNTGTVPVTTIIGDLYYDGVAHEVTVNTTVGANETVTVQLDEIAVANSAGSIYFVVKKLDDGLLESNAINNTSNTSTYLAFGNKFSDLLSDAEAETTAGAGSPFKINQVAGTFRVMVPYKQSGSNVGGFANSASSYYTNFYQWNPQSTAGTSEVVLDRIQFENDVTPFIKWDRAYSGYKGAEGEFYDGVEVLYSTDCNATWKSIWKKQGTALTTTTPVEPAFVPSAASQWTSDTVFIPELAGQAVHFKIRFISNWGNYFWLDNIQVNSKVGSATNQLETLTAISTYPNPVTNIMKIDLDMVKDDVLTISVVDVNGKTVATLAQNKVFTPGSYQLNWNAESAQSGVYIVKILGKNGQSAQKVSVIK